MFARLHSNVSCVLFAANLADAVFSLNNGLRNHNNFYLMTQTPQLSLSCLPEDRALECLPLYEQVCGQQGLTEGVDQGGALGPADMVALAAAYPLVFIQVRLAFNSNGTRATVQGLLDMHITKNRRHQLGCDILRVTTMHAMP